jgi:hypothetical protein
MGWTASALLGLGLALVASGCGRDERGSDEEPGAWGRSSVPSYMTGRYGDGRISIRYPEWWSESRSDRFGTVLGDNSTRHAAFVSVKYLTGDELPAREEFAAFAAEEIRPGGRLFHLYTQTARIHGVRGIEAAFVWPIAGTRGPVMRTFGFDRGPHGVAFLVFASERPETHARDFAWVKRSIVWMREPQHERRRPTPGGKHAVGY